jgi:hypothetical protein
MTTFPVISPSGVFVRVQKTRVIALAGMLAGITAGIAALILPGSLTASGGAVPEPAAVIQNVTGRTPEDAPIFRGPIVAVFPERRELIIRVQQNQDTYQIAAGAKVTRNHRPASLSLLAAGDMVIFRMIHKQSRSVTVLEALSSH